MSVTRYEVIEVESKDSGPLSMIEALMQVPQGARLEYTSVEEVASWQRMVRAPVTFTFRREVDSD